MSRESLEARFNARYIKLPGGCWTWKGAVVQGYGVLSGGGKLLKAHRVSFALANGAIPDGAQINHHCDNSLCVNPAHLYAGTQKDNCHDRESRNRGRRIRGSSHVNTPLSEEDVIKMRTMYVPRLVTHKQLATMFNVSPNTVGQIIRRTRWAHI